MIISHIQNLFAYNEWAWRRVFPSLAQLDNGVYKAPRGFFWDSLHGLMVHAAAAEFIWYQRLQGNSPTSLFDPERFADFGTVQTQWEITNQELQSYVAKLNEAELGRLVTYRNTRGQAFSLSVVQILQHVANHATEHRCQMTPVLYMLGVPTEPLDYMIFALKQ